MSLRKKIALGFFISAFIIALLAAFEYVNFVEIRKEIRTLETTDTIRSKSLQLRRHEKNFFLYGYERETEEAAAVRGYLAELDAILSKNIIGNTSARWAVLRERVHEYSRQFEAVMLAKQKISGEFQRIRPAARHYSAVFPFVESAFIERPLHAADFLEKVLPPPGRHTLVRSLRELDSVIAALRKSGEDILVISKELDSTARTNADRFIHISQAAILVVFPLFFIVGIGTLFFISGNVVNRLRLLIHTVEKTRGGHFPRMSVFSRWGKNDEVGLLIEKFNDMEDQLLARETEIEKKNRELLHGKKLAAIGTLASGVAHELNNPLNNIYISAQMLERETRDTSSPAVMELVGDIVGQTIRVKGIVADLLEFARGREPGFREIELNELIMGAYKLVSTSMNTVGITFTLDSDPGGIRIDADPEQMERVFINLFTNAVTAMSGEGDLKIRVVRENDAIKIMISDTGRGIPPEAVEKIFEPFYTTRDKGTGLGLAIVFNIIKKHGGDISVESAEGRGTTFMIVLPAEKRPA
jgi:two-component system NtrC family sensor kinase